MSSILFLHNPTASPLPRGFNLEFGSLSLHKKTHDLDDRGGDRSSKRIKLAPAAPRPRIPASSMVHGYRSRRGLPQRLPRTPAPVPLFYQPAWQYVPPPPPPPPPAPVPSPPTLIPMDLDVDPAIVPMDVDLPPKPKKVKVIRILSVVNVKSDGGAHRTLKRCKKDGKENAAPYPSTARLKGRRRV
ncbi:hypothetical protein FB45DRAFT_1027518 [Roridomyces roridus]|uniref:Uncharacterized protein n=1 Tax=Roridomyces roridus TaxID=1738132 RepID=A0AAD7FP34_9AGAR|nr:hypothetical protein FB45DRAFT_1027518 [Roridomyces roridus]